MQVIEYWDVIEYVSDQRDPFDIHVACFSTKEVATKFAETKSNHRVKPRKVLVVFDSTKEYLDRNNEEVRAKALDKLRARRIRSCMMNVGELIEERSKLDPETEVILQKDGEGNEHSPLYNIVHGNYFPFNSYSGDFYDDQFSADDCGFDLGDDADRLVYENLRAGPRGILLVPVN